MTLKQAVLRHLKEYKSITSFEAFNPMLANKLGKALVRLGFPSMHTFLLGDHRMSGTKQNEEFIAEYILLGGRTDEE